MLCAASRECIVGRHGRLDASAAAQAAVHAPIHLLDAGLELGDRVRVSAEAIFLARGHQTLHPLQIVRQVADDALPLREQLRGVRTCGHGSTTEDSIERIERLGGWRERVPGLVRLAYTLFRCQVGQRARSDLVAVGTDIGRQLQRSERRRVRKKLVPAQSGGLLEENLIDRRAPAQWSA